MRSLVIGLILACFLSGCSFLSGYHPPIQQGNVIAKKRLSSIKIGMSKATVQAILGTPVLNNLFEHNRWYYVYTYEKGNEPILVKHVTIIFKHDRVIQIIPKNI